MIFQSGTGLSEALNNDHTRVAGYVAQHVVAIFEPLGPYVYTLDQMHSRTQSLCADANAHSLADGQFAALQFSSHTATHAQANHAT